MSERPTPNLGLRGMALCESKGCPNVGLSLVLDGGVNWLACERHGGVPATGPRLDAEPDYEEADD